MKRVFIIHGWGGKPEHGWYLWLKKELEAKGFKAELPQMPDSEEPKIESWVSKLKEIVGKVDEETFFVGHSVGCQTILRYLQTLNDDTKLAKVILVAPWMHLEEKIIEEEGEEVREIARPWIETPIDFEKIRSFAEYICLFSDNDYYVPLSDSRIFKEKLNAEIIVQKEKWHFAGDDGINRIPALLDFFEKS